MFFWYLHVPSMWLFAFNLHSNNKNTTEKSHMLLSIMRKGAKKSAFSHIIISLHSLFYLLPLSPNKNNIYSLTAAYKTVCVHKKNSKKWAWSVRLKNVTDKWLRWSVCYKFFSSFLLDSFIQKKKLSRVGRDQKHDKNVFFWLG